MIFCRDQRYVFNRITQNDTFFPFLKIASAFDVKPSELIIWRNKTAFFDQ